MGQARAHQPHRHSIRLEGESEERAYWSFGLLEGPWCRSGEVVAYLDLLAEKAYREGKPRS